MKLLSGQVRFQGGYSAGEPVWAAAAAFGGRRLIAQTLWPILLGFSRRHPRRRA